MSNPLALSHKPFRDFIDLHTTAQTRTRSEDVSVVDLVVKPNQILGVVFGTRHYTVSIQYDSEKVESAKCNCPYEGPGKCKHIVRVLSEADLRLRKQTIATKVVVQRLDNYFLLDVPGVLDLTLDEIEELNPIPDRFKVTYWYQKNSIHSGELNKDRFTGTLIYRGDEYEFDVIQKDQAVLLKCSCNEDKIVCYHLQFLLKQIHEAKELHLSFNDMLRNQQLMKIAAEYGLEKYTDLERFFSFSVKRDQLQVNKRISFVSHSDPSFGALRETLANNQLAPWKNSTVDQEPFLLFYYSRFSKEMYVKLMTGEKSKNGQLKSPIREANLFGYLQQSASNEEMRFFAALTQIQHSQSSVTLSPKERIDAYNAILQNPLNFATYHYKDDGGKVTPVKLEKRELKSTFPNAVINVDEQEEFVTITAKIEIENRKLGSQYIRVLDGVFIKLGDEYFLNTSLVVAEILQFFNQHNHQLIVPIHQFAKLQEEFLFPLENTASVFYSRIKKAEKKEVKAQELNRISERLLYLSESEDHVLLTPVVLYGETEIPILSRRNLYQVMLNGERVLVERDQLNEDQFLRCLQDLHSDFSDSTPFDYYYLHRSSFLDNEWFLDAFEALRASNISVLGFNQLTKNKLNPNKAKINSKVISGLDWFDIHTTVAFGNQEVKLKDLQKAVFHKSKFVQLGDGTQGVLPDEWVEKFSHYFRSGEIHEGSIRTHKSSFHLIDEWFSDTIEDEELRQELDSYKEKFAAFQSIRSVAVPSTLKATLRPYQLEGLNWLNFLHEFGFGGCLADDMGLGKTVQIIAYILMRLEQGNQLPTLIVLPTSLLFNWKAELAKFAPGIRYLEWYGNNRSFDTKKVAKHQVVLTTYGTLISDIEKLRSIEFGIAVLDESQAIKNPDSKRYKAVRLLQAKQRLVVTGTPIENNTFDLFAQLSFAMPGFFGSAKRFADNYSTPIDRFQDTARAKELQHKIHPFILRRTKKQVAKELPEKTEMVLYCEMGKEQRSIYEAYKKEFHDFLNKTNEDELRDSSIHVLQGLTKLRQICNSPEILSDQEMFGTESAKLDELFAQIQEKHQHHKIIVFSQFVQMLELVKKKLDQTEIRYSYLTGQTKDRQAQVNAFQEQDEVRVFLISLKAGGTGLNLTQADYVFLVDPWWNPAVENQAIDRAYRIGQEKHVVAVRLITPNTIEEKILLLQERKKLLASDIVHTDTSVLKALSKNDLIDLLK